jgi:hypothetical protein
MSVSCECCVMSGSWSLIQRSPTECGVSKKCVIVKPRKMRWPRPPRACRATGGGETKMLNIKMSTE